MSSQRCAPLVCWLSCTCFCAAQGQIVADDWGWKEGRRNMVQIHDGKVDGAIEDLRKRLEKHPNHGEVLFALAVAYAHKGDSTSALASTRKALDAGLPFERFRAGPRDIVSPLTDLAEFQRLAAQHPAELLHGPMVGSVTESAARIWVRTAHEVTVRVLVRKQESPESREIESASVRTSLEQECTAVLDVGGLEPNTRYEYRLAVDGKVERETFTFRTFPRTGTKCKFKVVFGGGAAYTPSCERVFRTIASRRPLAFLQLGDNVYIDAPTKTPVQQYCYYRRQSSAPYRHLTARTCIAAIWDDHDFGTNDCRGGPDVDAPAWKRRVWQTFKNNWNNPSYGGGSEHPGCYFDFLIGDVHFLLLDGRYYRTRPKGKKRSMLGPVQKEWLFERLRSSSATFKIIASPVPFASGVKPGSSDPWDGYPEEREQIFSFVEQGRIGGVILIAADRHRSDVWKIPRPNGYDLYEFQSSRLTNIHTHGVMKGSLFGFNKERSFGLLSFDTTKDDPEITYTIVTIDNEPVYQLTLRRSQLKPRRSRRY